MSEKQKYHKIRLTKLQRFVRLLTAVFDPRAWAHGLKVINYFNYTNATPWREVKRGAGVVISPLANIANPQNLSLGDRVRISANVYLWPGPGTGRILLADDVMIGPGVMITASNYRYNDGSPITDQAMDEADVVIGRDVWIGYGAVILAGSEIGEGAVIGAAAVVRGKIPAFSIVSGNPAKVVGRRRDVSNPSVSYQPRRDGLELDANATVLAMIRTELPGLREADLSAPVDDSGIDSFDLITLRTTLEEHYGQPIPDREWASIASLSDIARLPIFGDAGKSVVRSILAPAALNTRDQGSSLSPSVAPVAATGILGPGRARRVQAVNMPQMALSGLSESWLFKELGDIHWAMITDFLKAPSSAIADDQGDRLYATFTRILLEAEPSLRGFSENDTLTIDSRLERQGAGFFFGHHSLSSGLAGGRAQTMSTFAKYGERGKNTSLMKGSPTLPEPDTIASLPALPEFGMEYRQRRSAEPGPERFTCDYEILPPHDINGVGLLYFAAYPTVFDLCLEKAEGKGFLIGHSTVSKDICYYANSEPTETLRFVLHGQSEEGGIICHNASLFRSSDGKRMAEVISRKRRL
jgi:probable biosynthetic protein (TIGR04098 family)